MQPKRRVARRSIVSIVSVLLAGSIAFPVASAAETHPHLRQGWLLGFGFGAGTSDTNVPAASSGRETGFAVSFRGGYAFNQRLSLELGGTAWTKDESGTTVALAVSGATLNFYPGEKGWVLRAGVGSGHAENSAQVGNVTTSTDQSGLGLMAGVGYELRVTRRFALSPQVYASWSDLDTFEANWFNFELGFNWYFFRQ